MWFGVTSTSERIRITKVIFDPLNYYNVSSPNTTFQSSKYCIRNYRVYSDKSKTTKPNMGVVESTPIACGPEENETRYNLEGARWIRTNLTYKILSYPHRTAILGGYAVIDREFKKAFTLWESVSEFRFTTSKDGYADIIISFLSGDFRYTRCFKLLYAHACYSLLNGDLFFNDDTKWTIGTTSLGADIFQTAVHNIGHTLGLGHFQRNVSVMCYGVCNNHVYRSNFTLHSDDIEAIKILYGKNSLITHRKQEEEKQQQQQEQQEHTLLGLPITWAAIGMACIILEVIIIVVGVIQIIRFRKQASERYWTNVEFVVSLK